MTMKDAYHFTRIDEIFTFLHNAFCLVASDLLMGYQQIPVSEEYRLKPAFITHKGLYVFSVMPFGLCNAPATLQRLIDGNFRGQIGKDLVAYIDDFLFYAVRHSVLLQILYRTLGQLFDTGLKCKPRKCEFFPDSIRYLGLIIKY